MNTLRAMNFRQSTLGSLAASLLFFASVGCGDDDASVAGECRPGDTAPCTCDDGAPGTAPCDGVGEGTCQCAPMMTDGGTPPAPDAEVADECGFSTCGGGCCDDGECEPGTRLSACGSSGDTCEVCGAGEQCGDAGCELDPSSEWRIRLLDVSVPERKLNGDSWDALGGAPDVSVRVYSADEVLLGTVDGGSDTLNPTLDETLDGPVTAAVLLEGLTFEVYDRDTSFDDSVASCSQPIQDETILGGAIQTRECMRDNTFVLRWRIVPGS